jgi:TPR repeat protein
MDEAEAIELHLRLAGGCKSYERYCLGYIHENGNDVGKDMAKAAKLYRLVADIRILNPIAHI